MPKDRERLLNALFLDTPEAMVIADACRRIVDINPAFTRLLGYKLEEVQGKLTEVLYADKANFEQSGEQVFNAEAGTPGDRSAVLYFSYKRKDGTIFAARTLAIRLVDDDGEVTGLVGIINDLRPLVTAAEIDLGLVRAAQIGASERALVDVLFEKFPGMIHTCDEQGIIHRVSRQWLDRMGYEAGEVIGKTPWDFMATRDIERSRSGIEEVWNQGSRHRVPYTFITKSGEEVEIELSATLDISEDKRMALVLLDDVTERNHASRELEDRNAQLREFARVTAHDLQAPLRHIKLFAEMIAEDAEAKRYDTIGDAAADLRTSAVRLSDMVKSLLDFSLTSEARIRTEDCNLGVLIGRVLSTTEDQVRDAGARIDVDALPIAHCDPILMERVFENLISNALKYVADGVPPRVSVRGKADGADLLLCFEDNGIGVAPEFRERIFDPLRRLHGPDSAYQGSGIGLSLCQQIVGAHGGRIWVEDGRAGSCFFIHLPDCLKPASTATVVAFPARATV